jgi:spore maturation protein CgeB
VNDPTNLDRFRDVNRSSHYIPHAYDPAIHRRSPPTPAYAGDFGFVGTGYASRVEFFEKVDWSGISVRLAGHWGALDDDSPLDEFLVHPRTECFDDTIDLYSSVKVSANLYRREAQRDELAEGWAMGPREVELAACGTFFLRHPRGEGDDLLPMLPTFTEPAEFGDLLRWWLAHDTQRDTAASQARAAVADRTFSNHAQQFLRLLA